MTKAPPKRQTHSELRELQRLAAHAIMRPLTGGYRMQPRWIDNRDMRIVADEFIKPNDRLSAFERIEIYNRQYWFRLIDCLFDDYPGLLAVLGRERFTKLARAYLDRYPSRSFTLRNLGSRLLKFIQQCPELVAPRYDLAIDMVKFEWAQVEAFDLKAEPIVKIDDLLGKDPAKVKLSLQPHISLLALGYPLDDYVLQLKQDGLRGEASNALEESVPSEKRKKKVPLPRRQKTFVVVHRYKNALYYKRLEPEAYHLLLALQKGRTLVQALDDAFDAPPDATQVKEWFETWAGLGWFCRR